VVHDFILDEQRAWDALKLDDVFDDESVENVPKIPIPYAHVNESYIWGRFMVESAYQAYQASQEVGGGSSKCYLEVDLES